MATKIYNSENIFLIDNTEVYLTPLKIKYLRQIMDIFNFSVKTSESQDEIVDALIDCVAVAMKQYYPKISNSEDVEDSITMPTVYKILEVGAGIKLSKDAKEDDGKDVRAEDLEAGADWETFDLAKLESEAFLLGIWKDYEELESSLSMPELIETIKAKRESEYEERKFFAAIQGIDIEKESGKGNAWEEMKARVFSKGQASNANDIVAYQGANAQKAGFGIGLGLDYERID
jgi:hypothetical protein